MGQDLLFKPAERSAWAGGCVVVFVGVFSLFSGSICLSVLTVLCVCVCVLLLFVGCFFFWDHLFDEFF